MNELLLKFQKYYNIKLGVILLIIYFSVLLYFYATTTSTKDFRVSYKKTLEPIETKKPLKRNPIKRNSAQKEIPVKPTNTVCQIPPLKKMDDFFEYGKKGKYKCKNLKIIGGHPVGRDGSKFVCFDKLFEVASNNCVVLSFGIGFDFSFDDAMSKIGCTVYSFDPTMGMGDHNRTPKIHFYDLGISDLKGKILRPKSKFLLVEEFDRYENILKKLHLTNTKIDYLKMDIEGYEFKFLKDVLKKSSHLLQNVKQIGMEVHPGKASPTEEEKFIKKSKFFQLWNYIHQLECLGFELVHFVPNLAKVNRYKFRNRTESTCFEVVWVKK